MKTRALEAFVIASCIIALPALVAAQGDGSRSAKEAESSARSSVPTGDPLANRKAVDEENSSAPASRPRVKDGGGDVPVIPVPPVAPAGD